MGVNRHRAHLIVVPEDDANRQIANGFEQIASLVGAQFRIATVSGGWTRVREDLLARYSQHLKRYPMALLLLLVDFDGTSNRVEEVKRDLDPSLMGRVFVLGAKTNPEDLRRAMNLSFEAIGLEVGKACLGENASLWCHELLQHNQPELQRLEASVKPFLFV